MSGNKTKTTHSLFTVMADKFRGSFEFSSAVDWFIKFADKYLRENRPVGVKQTADNIYFIFGDGSELPLLEEPIVRQTVVRQPELLQTHFLPVTESVPITGINGSGYVDYRDGSNSLLDKRIPGMEPKPLNPDLLNR